MATLPEFEKVFGRLATDPMYGEGSQGNGVKHFMEADYAVASAVIDGGVKPTMDYFRSLAVARSMLAELAERAQESEFGEQIKNAIPELDRAMTQAVSLGRSR